MQSESNPSHSHDPLTDIIDGLELVQSDDGNAVPPSPNTPLNEISDPEVLSPPPFNGQTVTDEIGEDSTSSAADDESRSVDQEAPAHTVLLSCAQTAEFFSTPKDQAYATFYNEHGPETSRIDGDGFQDWLRYQYYLATEDAPPTEALKKALATLEAKARYDSPTHEVHLRVAPHPDPDENCIYIDLGDEKRQVISITGAGWDIIEDPPVRFYRTENTHALPLPVLDDDKGLQRLRKYANLGDDHFALLLGFLVQCFNPRGPYPLLCLHGQQGSGKSTLTRIIRSIVDPAQMATQSLPSSTRDLAIAAENDWILAFDNSSSISKDISDALCRLATGAGFSTRSLYSDRGQEIFENSRAVVLNGIEQVVDRSDLADRSIFVELQPISDEERKTEHELWTEFKKDRPHILGALIDAVQTALKRREEVEMKRMPRMADFAEWVVAAIPALPITRKDFQRAFRINQEDAARKLIAEEPVAQAILNLLDDAEGGTWTGTMSELREALASYLDDHVFESDLPSTPQKMTAVMKRIWPGLQKVGVERSENDVSHDSHRAFRMTVK